MKSGIIKIEDTFKPFEHHVYTVLKNSTIKPTTSLFQHLEYRYSLRRSQASVDHDYCQESYCQERVNCNNETKMDLITNSIQRAFTAKCVAEVREETDKKQVSNPVTVDTSKVLYEAISQDKKVIASIEGQLQEKRPSLTINISNLKAPYPCGPNYHDVLQNTNVWEDLRKFKITGSRLPALLGSHEQEKFIKYWKVVKEGLKESDVINTNFENFKRGHKFEKEAISVFCNLSNSETQTCGFFEDPSDSNYGASPDALAASSLILEVKTRAAKPEGPLTSLKQLPSYYIQPQLEMVCTGASYCILESYHPETQQASFFLIKRDDVLMSVIKDITNSILNEKPLLEWSHSENNHYKRLGGNVAGRIPDFASIKPLKSHINALVKSVPMVKFSK